MAKASRDALQADLEERRTVVMLLNQHIVAENAENVTEIMQTMVREPVYALRYMPFHISDRWWWSHKYWKGQEAVEAYYYGLFRMFKNLDLTLLYYAVSSKGIVDCYRFRGSVFSRLLNFPRLGIRGIPVRMTLYSFLPYDRASQKLAGEQIYLTTRALRNLI
jgi:hypothetical protein